ncbi:MAG: hypothetical protein N4A47_06555 [Clostridia bacterium]|jgi:hypothetical protein|nr:hypothetical protein [Clostridia bacterium]
MSVRPIDLQISMQQNQEISQLKQHELKVLSENENIFAKELEKKYNDDSHRVTDTEETEKVYFRKKDDENDGSQNGKKKDKDEAEDDELKLSDKGKIGVNTAEDSHIDIRI